MTYFFLLVYCTTTTQCYRWMTFERFVKCAVKEVPFSWLLGRENKQSLGSSCKAPRKQQNFFSLLFSFPFLAENRGRLLFEDNSKSASIQLLFPETN